jgi:hypothetical protein
VSRLAGQRSGIEGGASGTRFDGGPLRPGALHRIAREHDLEAHNAFGERTAVLALFLATFLVSLLVRTWRMDDIRFAMDQSTTLWMAWDSLHSSFMPDHGLVSSYGVFEPPGLIWVALPSVIVGAGDPRATIIWLALLDSLGLALLVWAIAREGHFLLAAVVAALTSTGAIAAEFVSWIWHPSLYEAAMAVTLAALLRLHAGGSRGWAAVPVGIPAFYTLIHYSGLALFPGALLVLPIRRWRTLLPGVSLGVLLAAIAWLPFLAFEMHRDLYDFRHVVAASEIPPAQVTNPLWVRLTGIVDVARHWGGADTLAGSSWMYVIVGAGVTGLVLATMLRARVPLIAAAVLLIGTATQAATGLSERQDVDLLWGVPLLILAAFALVHLRRRVVILAIVVPIVVMNIVTLNALRNSDSTGPNALNALWMFARLGLDRPPNREFWFAQEINSCYLPTDPPYLDGADVWYLREIAHPGDGRQIAAAHGSFDTRHTDPHCG